MNKRKMTMKGGEEMLHSVEVREQDEFALELGMQELEALEAPGWWSVTGYISGAGVGGAVTYSVVATAISAT
jgi:hypothetical protein